MDRIFMLTIIATVLMSLSLFEAANGPSYFRKFSNLIKYRFQEQFENERMIIMRRAIKDLEKIVCVNITETTNQDEDVLVFDGRGCFSSIGKKKYGEQRLSLSTKGCQTDSSTKHEFMHLLGLNHEQSRKDRDDYINVNMSRIYPHTKINFDNTRDNDKNYGPFDFQSNMFYTPWKLSKTLGRPIWTYKNTPEHEYETPLDRGSISWQDAKALNEIWECGEHCINDCEPEGYLNKDCECITPDSFAKQQCYDVRSDCESWLLACQTDEIIMSECRKTCKTCYKSPNGNGERGTIEACDDYDHWLDGQCRILREENSETINQLCQGNTYKYYCRKTCGTGCLKMDLPKIVDKCQDLIPSCEVTKENCDTTNYKMRCAKTCGHCT